MFIYKKKNKNGKIAETAERMKAGAEKYYKNLGIWRYSASRRYCQVPTGAALGRMARLLLSSRMITEIAQDFSVLPSP